MALPPSCDIVAGVYIAFFRIKTQVLIKLVTRDAIQRFNLRIFETNPMTVN